MRVLVEIVHPANVLFFTRPMRHLRERGDEVRVVSRHKDMATTLLDSMSIEHTPISRAGSGLFGLASELLVRDTRLAGIVRKFRPHVMIGFGGLAISHVGRLLGVPAVAFYDTEVAKLQNRLAWPFITHLYVPDSYSGEVPAGRHTRVPGSKDLSYFHPSAFRASTEIAVRNGLDPQRDNFFVRLVSWRANHDLGKSGLSLDAARPLITRLQSLGKVHLSSERPLPPDLETLRYRGTPLDVHHLLAHCRLCIGESATMACEAALLGTPSIYASTDFRGYVEQLVASGLIVSAPEPDGASLIRHVEGALARDRSQTAAARDAWMQGKPDWAQVVVEALDRHALRDTARS